MASPTNTRTALITGASHGIGYEFARLFARDGYRLILVARDKESMDQHADHLRQNFGIDVHVFARDLSLPAAADELYRAVMAQALTVDVLINNAGFCLFGNFDTTYLAREVGMLQLNVTALME
ncbi:MAG: short-chain dehydrogenase, partial [Candidatus Peribacteria bacterium]|nr:short-chain dehydrogenase [Candidatus Peribacteria bacterium]